jgi:hydroxyethylthiazole kinase-like uncharacterized protein yjeF
VFLYGDAEKLPPDAKENYARWSEIGECACWDDHKIEDELDVGDFELVVDALFGIGLTRSMPADTERTWHAFMPRVFTDRVRRYVAVDTPSGICSDSGRNLEGAFPTNLTVTFHRPKICHVLQPSAEPIGGAVWCGALRIVDIGMSQLSSISSLKLIGSPSISDKLQGHKYSHGHALILSGGIGKGGAARLAARGALRIGAGAVTVGCPADAVVENAAQLNAVMLTSVNDATTLDAILMDARINALCVGPGLGLGAREAALVASVLESGRAAVLDADALTLLARDAGLFAKLHKSCVLTPHAGEFSRLFPDIAEKLNASATKGPAYSKVDATREAAKRAGCVVLYKGPDTVIADPSGRCSINASVYERAAPWLATAGSGDVLAGFIAGLLARGFAPMQAAETGAWLHTECALKFGPGLIAEDLPEQLPAVLRALNVP